MCCCFDNTFQWELVFSLLPYFRDLFQISVVVNPVMVCTLPRKTYIGTAGFINETSILWLRGSKWISVKNCLYNLCFAALVFLGVVYSVRLAFFYDIRFYLG